MSLEGPTLALLLRGDFGASGGQHGLGAVPRISSPGAIAASDLLTVPAAPA